MLEQWKAIPGFLGYDISDRGRVRSYFTHKGRASWYVTDEPQRMLSSINTCRYPAVLLRKDGVSYRKRIHGLVLLAFVGRSPDGLEVCHNDGDPTNNHLSNLRYGTHKSNMEDAVKHFGWKDGIIITPKQVIEIRQLGATGMLHRDIATRFSISTSSVSAICTGKTRLGIGGPITERHKVLSDQDVIEIRERYANSEITQQELANEFSVDYTTIYRLCAGERRVAAGGPITKYRRKPRCNAI